MLSLITTQTHIPNSRHPFSRLNIPLAPSPILAYNPQKRAKFFKKAAILSRYLGSDRILDTSWRCLCKQSEGDSELEAEIMGFMANSAKPSMFPTRQELMRAGRKDLVEAIKKRGGWYSLGWEEEEESVGDNVGELMDFDIEEFQRRVDSCKESATLREQYDDSFFKADKEDSFSSEVLNSDSLQLATSASLDIPLENGVDVDDSGIDGILSRLEKQRNINFGINLEKNMYEAHAKRKHERDDRHFDSSLGVDRIDHGENGRLPPKISSTTEPETWRTWSNQRAGFQHTDFEAAKISFSRNEVEADKEGYHDGITVYAEGLYELNHNHMRTRLQHLECELNEALHSLRSKREGHILDEVTGGSSDFQKLSDAWEFQENELMSAQERLRSIRAKLAVIEGKMTLAVIDAQRMVEVKQKRIDNACKALQLLRTTCIVWPNSASEVFLAGSFDGWTSERKMEKSKTGIFSVCLKLYPGRYEIKFIVDGFWKIDPLRPIVNNNGHENNLFIVT